MSDQQPEFVEIDGDNAIHYIHHAPKGDLQTFFFLNSMGGNTDAWEDRIAPLLRSRGYGTLSFDFRGQGKSRYGADALLEPSEIIADTCRVSKVVAPVRPIMVGQSIGGMFGAHAWLKGAKADAIVFVNTLRKRNAQVEWINTLEARLIAMGGMPLVLDVLRPMLSGREELERLRPTHLSEDGYTPWPEDHPRLRLARNVDKSDWDLPYEKLTAPALVVTGLHDRFFRIQEDVDELVARLPDATVITYADGGHSLPSEHPERFVDDIIGFVQKLQEA